MLVYIIGCGVYVFIYDLLLGVFCLCQECMCFLEKGKIYFINEGNYIKFLNGVKKYIKFCQEEDSLISCFYILCYIGFLVVDFYCNLLKGGIYFYFSIVSYLQGKLCLLYECNLMVFFVEQVGGKVSDGKECILDIILESLYQCCLFFVGNCYMVDDVECFICEYLDV